MLEYWLWLTGRRGFGLRGLRALLEQFGTPEAVYCAAAGEYPQELRPEGRAALADKELAPARQILQQCYRKNIHVLTFQDAVYPNRLKNLDDAPLVLYYQGVFPDFDAEPVIAMVGTRKASAYGLLQAKRLGYELGRYGAIVVSGGAAGIDTMALRGAVSSGTPPVAVFACGVDVDYPASNRSLFEDLRTHGCVISELPPGTPPLPEHFPPRNRLLSGLSLGSVVVEAPKKSGALITARHALEHFRLRHKTAWRNIDYDFRFCVILHRQGKCAIFLASRSFLHTIRYFFLYHDRDTVDRHMAFKQSHDDRSRNVIRKICNDLDRFPVIFFFRKF